ncbi:MAG: leucyl aminopeptidase [Deltaproteobacteria bacterium]|nr:leucyl aminopeptidase [Deltaproteobacteria bacterium]
MKIRLGEAAPERVDADLVVLVVASDTLARLRSAKAAGPAVVRMLERQRFTGAEGTSALLRTVGRSAKPLAIVGVGASTQTNLADAYRRAGDQTVARGREARARTVAVGFLAEPTRLPLERPETLAAFVEGALLTGYGFTRYRHDRDRVELATLTLAGLVGPRDPALRRAVRAGEILAGATNQARDWINEPAAVMTPAAFAADAERVLRSAGLEVRVDGPAGIRKLGMGALLGVARGSAEEPRFVRVVYRPPGADKAAAPSPAAAPPPSRRLAFVGKGITFDSGGLSLKRPDGMEHMKRDMAGGAAVLGAMLAIAALKPAIEVRAYVPASENMPGGSALKPGDVLRTPAGKTVEVLNTDAEGRLVLADALAIAAGDRPDAIVDVATLTGAVRSALGNRIAGIMGNDRALVAALIAAGAEGGERLWELPLVADYLADLESAVADLANVAEAGHGGAIHAGLFLREFVGALPWAHLDIAGVGFTDRDIPNAPRGGVGFGVRLLARYALAAAAPGGRGAPPRS